MLDRALQESILRTLSATYPVGTYDLTASIETQTGHRHDEHAVLVNTQYLAEHGLLVSGYRRIGLTGGDPFTPSGEHIITAAGLDFLADDGGLGAILGVLTVRFAPSALAELAQARIEASDLPAEEKSRLKRALHSLGQEAWSEATKRLVGAALDHWPTALAWLRTLPG